MSNNVWQTKLAILVGPSLLNWSFQPSSSQLLILPSAEILVRTTYRFRDVGVKIHP